MLETVGAGSPRVVGGEPALAGIPACPASTFKVVIAIAAMEGGVASPDSTHPCREMQDGKVAREINMREAMRASDNEYFLWLANRIGAVKITETARRLGFFEDEVTGDWLGGDASSIVRGGTRKVTPQRLHDFMVRVMRGGATSGPRVQRMLEDVLSWPGDDAGSRVFGKTGAWGGAVWFTGIVDRAGERRAITVFVPYEVPQWRPARSRAIDLFYERAGMPRPPGA